MPRPPTKKKLGALALLDRMAGAGGGEGGKKDERLRFDDPGLAPDIAGYIDCDGKSKEWASRAAAHAERVKAKAEAARVEACRRARKAEASILVNGRLNFTRKCQFSAVDAAKEPTLRRAFGPDAARYFAPSLTITLTAGAAADEETLELLLAALGEERFLKTFAVTRGLKVTPQFYEDWTLRPDVAEAAAPLIADETIKPAKPSLSVA